MLSRWTINTVMNKLAKNDNHTEVDGEETKLTKLNFGEHILIVH
jgi:hypothetical protein